MDTKDHEAFAKETNGEVWRLLEKADRTPADDEQMIHAAHASCYHWLFAGTALHQQRGEWLIARVYTVLGEREAAERHTRRRLALTEAHRATSSCQYPSPRVSRLPSPVSRSRSPAFQSSALATGDW